MGITPERKNPLIPSQSHAALVCEIATAITMAHRVRNARAVAARTGMSVILPIMSRTPTTKLVVGADTNVTEEDDAQRVTHVLATTVIHHHRQAATNAQQGHLVEVTVEGVSAAGPKPHLAEEATKIIVVRRDDVAAARQNGTPTLASSRMRLARPPSRVESSFATRGRRPPG